MFCRCRWILAFVLGLPESVVELLLLRARGLEHAHALLAFLVLCLCACPLDAWGLGPWVRDVVQRAPGSVGASRWSGAGCAYGPASYGPAGRASCVCGAIICICGIGIA